MISTLSSEASATPEVQLCQGLTASKRANKDRQAKCGSSTPLSFFTGPTAVLEEISGIFMGSTTKQQGKQVTLLDINVCSGISNCLNFYVNLTASLNNGVTVTYLMLWRLNEKLSV